MRGRLRGNGWLAALAIGIAFAGCGGGGNETAQESAQKLAEVAGSNDAENAVKLFFKAGNERDAKTVCDLVTDEAAQTFGQAGGGSCEHAMTALFEAEDPPRIKVIIEDVRVLNDRATVDVTITQGGETRPTSLDLIQEGGEWKLTDPGV
jgi:hypothetical protein